MVKKGDIIGISDGEVYFVGSVKNVDGTEVVSNVSGYRPVDKEQFEHLRDKDWSITWDDYDTFHFLWKDAVAHDFTEESYEEFAERIWDEADRSENPLWFLGQDCSGEGEVLIENKKLHKKVKADLAPLIDFEIGSWESSCWTDPFKRGTKEPMEWDVVYNKEAVEACNRYCDLITSGYDYWKIVRAGE